MSKIYDMRDFEHLRSTNIKLPEREVEMYKLAPRPRMTKFSCVCEGKGWFYCDGNKKLGCDDVQVRHIHTCTCKISNLPKGEDVIRVNKMLDALFTDDSEDK
jgi:hypothetical protein